MRELIFFHANVQFVEQLVRSRCCFLVIGSVALNFHIPERQFDDLDLLFPPTIKNAEKVLSVLMANNLSPPFTALELARPRTQLPIKDHLYLDIVVASSAAEFSTAWGSAEDVKCGMEVARVASPRTLLQLLADSDQPKHRQDIELLKRLLASEE